MDIYMQVIILKKQNHNHPHLVTQYQLERGAGVRNEINYSIWQYFIVKNL